MPKVIIVIGMPGSGKSTYFKNKLKTLGLDLYDDFHGSAIGNSTDFDKSRHYQDLKASLQAGKDSVISDVEYCGDARLKEAQDGITKMEQDLGITIKTELVFFENNPNACRHNVVHRYNETGGKTKYLEELAKIDRLTKNYQPPESVMPVATCCSKLKSND